MKRIYLTLIFAALLVISVQFTFAAGKITSVGSPDQSTVASFRVSQDGHIEYELVIDQHKIIEWSRLGIGEASEKITIAKITRDSHSEKFKWINGENDWIVNNYNEVNIYYSVRQLKYRIQVRIFNRSLAFRYFINGNQGLKYQIESEQTSFNFGKNYKLYQYHHESVFTEIPIDQLATSCDFPATLTDGKNFISIGEAENLNYTKAELRKGKKDFSLKVSFERDSTVSFMSSFKTPWRTISASGTAIGLHEFSDLNMRLSAAPKKTELKWKPGKVIRSQLSTQDGLNCVDLASKLGFGYVLFDAGWYGPERAKTSDPRKAIEKIDLPKVIQYAKAHQIGIILYVNYIGLQNYLDEILPLYRKWDVAGIKFGFIDGFTQNGLSWLSVAIKKVNDAGLLLNIHDNYKPTGLSRTYPSLFTQEGIRGDENSPDAYHTTVLPYTRFLAGAADFTFCYPNPKNSFSKNLKVSKVQQLALTVAYFSPLQAIFWYGKPEDYTNNEEIEFFKYVPTTWNQSIYLQGEIGRNISVARRNGKTWFVGNVAGLDDWEGKIILNFLSPNIVYIATIYEDDGNTIIKRELKVKKNDSLNFNIKAKGGQAVILREVSSSPLAHNP